MPIDMGTKKTARLQKISIFFAGILTHKTLFLGPQYFWVRDKTMSLL